MVTRTAAALAGCALAGCFDADYQCRSDADCDVGVAGRCEVDHRCTAFDPSCAIQRRYSDHSGSRSGQCFDDQATPVDLCAAGQPPAAPAGCALDVCEALPACCATGWSEACVQAAQIACGDLVCDTRIAITASKANRTELWDLRWDGATWSARPDRRQGVLAWLAPAPGTGEPRLAGFAQGALVVDDVAFPVAAKNSYLEATSVDFDRDGRPTAVLAYTDGGGSHLEVRKLDDGSARVVASVAVPRLSWGDVDHDAFPDGIAAEGTTTRYHLLSSNEAEDHARAIDDRVVANVTGSTSGSGGNPPPIRSFDWIDLDGDHQLDVVAFGFSVDVHPGKGEAIGTAVLGRIDCDPPAASGSCDATEQAAQAFAGAALPGKAGSALVIASHPARGLFRTQLRGTPAMVTATPYVFPTEACAASCAPILAVVARDLDGDHALDVIAIDADLHVYTALASGGMRLESALAIPSQASGFLAVRTSVTGAVR